MRLGIVAGSILLLAGCAAIPPAVSVATWAIEGASLAFSGKSVSDHAISAVTCLGNGRMGCLAPNNYPPPKRFWRHAGPPG